MKKFKFTIDAVALVTAVVLLATTATITAAQANSREQFEEAKQKLMQQQQETNRAAQLSLVIEVKNREAQASRPVPAKTKLQKYAEQREKLSASELRELLALVGFEGKALKEAWAIVMKESTGRPTAHNGNSATGDNSYGLFQINMIGGLGEDRRNKFDLKQNSDLFNPVRNAEIAYHMSNGGKDFGAWGIGPNAYNGGKAGSFYEWLAKYPD